jgi:CHAT domain-containing protein/tetratricopeptide (TPR) repeat protein
LSIEQQHEEGRQLLLEGLELYQQRNGFEALDRLERGLEIMRRTGDRQLEEVGLKALIPLREDLGGFHRGQGRPAEALEQYELVLSLCRELGDASREAAVSQTIGELRAEVETLEEEQAEPSAPEGAVVLNREEGLREAVRRVNQALSETRESGDRSTEGSLLCALGILHRDLGEPAEARARSEEALPILRETGDREGEVEALNNLGSVYQDTNLLDDALRHYQLALATARKACYRRGEGAALNNLGSLYLRLDRAEALRDLQRALEIAREVGDETGEARALHNLGLLHGDSGQYREMLADLEQALAVAPADPHTEAGILSSLGAGYEQVGESAKAADRLRAALDISRRLGHRKGEAFALLNLGVNTLRNLSGEDGEPADEPEADQQAQRAVERWMEAQSIYRELGDLTGEIQVWFNLGQLLGLRSPREGLRELEYAVELAEDVRSGILSEELRTAYFATVGDIYAVFVSRLVETEKPEHRDRALHAAERGRARAFLDLLAQAEAEVHEGVDPGLREKELELLGELSALHSRLVEARSRSEGERDQGLISDLEGMEQEVKAAYRQNQAEIRKRNPRAAITQLTAWELPEIQEKLLDERTALLEYVLGERKSILFCVTKDRFEVFDDLPPKMELEARVRELRAAVLARLPRYPHGHALYEALIAPAAGLIEGKELLVCADGALHYLPFSLLLTRSPDDAPEPPPLEGGEELEERELAKALIPRLAPLPPFEWAELPYLLRDYPIRYAPSATVAGLVREEAEERDYDSELAALADPKTEERKAEEEEGDELRGAPPVELEAALAHTHAQLEPLPMTAVEAWALAELLAEDSLPASRPEDFDDERVAVRTAAAATKAEVERLTSGGRSFRFFHLASHGLLDPEKPQFSGLVFSAQRGADPFWRTFEIFNARIPSELVVLSACETGLGRVVRGEGIVGLSRAFLYAGARAVCVSLWRVADASSPPLMKALYEGIREPGRSKAEALQEAQLRFLAGELVGDFYGGLPADSEALRGIEPEDLEGGGYLHPFYWAPFVLVGEG